MFHEVYNLWTIIMFLLIPSFSGIVKYYLQQIFWNTSNRNFQKFNWNYIIYWNIVESGIKTPKIKSNQRLGRWTINWIFLTSLVPIGPVDWERLKSKCLGRHWRRWMPSDGKPSHDPLRWSWCSLCTRPSWLIESL